MESYATVHRAGRRHPGEARPECSAVERAALLPWRLHDRRSEARTMEIIDRLEARREGLLRRRGDSALNGSADLSIAIRSAVRHGDTSSVRAGGATSSIFPGRRI